MAHIIHSYCNQCLIIKDAPFKLDFSHYIDPGVYMRLSRDAGHPVCLNCSTKDVPIMAFTQDVKQEIRDKNSTCSNKDQINLNHYALHHLTDDHHRLEIAHDIVPRLHSILPMYLYAIVCSSGDKLEIDYYIKPETKIYKIPVKRIGQKWRIRSIFEINTHSYESYLTKPNGIVLPGPGSTI